MVMNAPATHKARYKTTEIPKFPYEFSSPKSEFDPDCLDIFPVDNPQRDEERVSALHAERV